MSREKIQFNRPYMTGKELWYISQAHANGHLAGDGSALGRGLEHGEHHGHQGDAVLPAILFHVLEQLVAEALALMRGRNGEARG